jgi:hypothetical protein
VRYLLTSGDGWTLRSLIGIKHKVVFRASQVVHRSYGARVSCEAGREEKPSLERLKAATSFRECNTQSPPQNTSVSKVAGTACRVLAPSENRRIEGWNRKRLEHERE